MGKLSTLAQLDLRLSDADRLLQLHEQIGGVGPGRKHNVDVLNRSAVILAVAAWEAFCEDLVWRNAASLAKRIKQAADLPSEIRDPMLEWYYSQNGLKTFNRSSKSALWNLTGHGWRNIYRDFAQYKSKSLNTPNADNVKKIFRTTLAIDDVTTSWRYQRWGPEVYIAKLDEMLTLRHRIAHGSIRTETVGKGNAEGAVRLVRNLGRRTVEAVSQNFKRFDLQGRNAKLKPA